MSHEVSCLPKIKEVDVDLIAQGNLLSLFRPLSLALDFLFWRANFSSPADSQVQSL